MPERVEPQAGPASPAAEMMSNKEHFDGRGTPGEDEP
jgi:hypothetical protein